MQIEARRNVTIKQNLASGNAFTAVINNVSFIPDEVIVKQITYHHQIIDPDDDAYAVWTDIVGDYIGSFFDGSSCSPNITYPLQKSVQGIYNFKVHTTAGV